MPIILISFSIKGEKFDIVLEENKIAVLVMMTSSVELLKDNTEKYDIVKNEM